MPLPRKKDDGSSGAPVLDLLSAHVRLIDVEEHTEPFTVTRKSDGSTYTLDPQFKCSVEIVDDREDGTDNGTKFFEYFKYKRELKRGVTGGKVWTEQGDWINSENSKLGMLTKVVKPGYFADESIPALTADDLEGFEMNARVKPKKNPHTGQVTGSTIDWETMKPLPNKLPPVPPVEEAEADFDDGSLDDIPPFE